MYYKEFRHMLVVILDTACVPKDMRRELFIKCCWKRKNENKCLFQNDIEEKSCRFVIKKLKMANMYYEYRSFMGDWLAQ